MRTNELAHCYKDNYYREIVMALMCPMSGCSEKKGMCVHDKMMVIMGLVIIGYAVYRFLL